MEIKSQQQPSQHIQGISSGSMNAVRSSENVTMPCFKKAVNTSEILSLQGELLKQKKDTYLPILSGKLEVKAKSQKPSSKNDSRYFRKGKEIISRFQDIPSRVETRVGNGLHANNIIIDNKKIAIATQYPVTEQLNNFLEMIVQEETSLIVVLSSKSEIDNHNNKMYGYFNHAGSYGNKENIKTISEKIEGRKLADGTGTGVDTYNLRINRHDNHFPVKVLHVTDWPDHGVLSVEETIELAELVIKALGNNEVPVIHCRAGVGRTGLLTCVVAMLQNLSKEISLERVIEDMRESRNERMVQNDEQLKLLIAIWVKKGWPVLKEEEPRGETQPRTSGLLKNIQSAIPSKTVDPASPLLRKKNNEKGQVIIDARGVRNAGNFEDIFGKIIKSKSKDDGEYKNAAMVIGLRPLQQSGELMQRIHDNRTPVMVILGEHTENSLIEGVHNFFTKEKDYGDGIKFESTEAENKKLSGDLNVSVYSTDLWVKDKGITIPVIHAYNLPDNFFHDKQLINILTEEINYHFVESVEHYKSKKSSAIDDQNKLLPVFVYPKKSDDVQGLIDAVIKSIKR